MPLAARDFTAAAPNQRWVASGCVGMRRHVIEAVHRRPISRLESDEAGDPRTRAANRSFDSAKRDRRSHPADSFQLANVRDGRRLSRRLVIASPQPCSGKGGIR